MKNNECQKTITTYRIERQKQMEEKNTGQTEQSTKPHTHTDSVKRRKIALN